MDECAVKMASGHQAHSQLGIIKIYFLLFNIFFPDIVEKRNHTMVAIEQFWRLVTIETSDQSDEKT